jgi:thymidylate kinase
VQGVNMKIDNQLVNFFNSIEHIDYIVFKSIVHIKESIRGETDFDILISRKNINFFIDIAISYGFIVSNIGALHKFNDVVNMLYFNKSTGNVVHLHMHMSMITGKKGVKEFEILFDKAIYHDYTVFSNFFPVKIINKNAEIGVRHLRAIAKKEKDIAGMIYSDFPEYRDLYNEKKLDLLVQKSLNKYKLKLIKRKSLLKTTLEKVYIYIMFFLSKVINYLSLNGRTYHHSGFRYLHSPVGLRIAIIGVDGSGKTTTVQKLEKGLRKKIWAKKILFGCKEGGVFYKIIRFGLMFCIRHTKENGVIHKLLYPVYYLFIALKRLNQSVVASKLERNNCIVIFDRYVTGNSFIQDGPSILNFRMSVDNGLLFSFYCKIMAKFEEGCYRRIGTPDLTVVLFPPIETILLRRKEDNKNVLLKKNSLLNNYILKNSDDEMKRTICLDTNKVSQQDVIYQIKKEVFEIIYRKTHK